MRVRYKYYMMILSSILACLLLACLDNHEQPIKGKPIVPDTAVVIEGSFENKFVRYEKGQAFSGEVVKTWSDTLWQNDRTHKQLVLWTKKANVTDLSYKVSDLRGENTLIDRKNIKLRFASYVKGDKQALDCDMQSLTREAVLQADALSPTSVTSISVNDPLKIWITLDIPSGTTPGRYKGDITVKLGKIEQEKFEIDILVVDHELPAVKDWSFHLDFWQFPYQLTQLVQQNGGTVKPFSSEYFQMVKPFYTMLADAGQVAITTYIKDGAFSKGQSMVKWTKKTDGSWSFDYADFDKFVETMMSWGINKQINCFSLVGWNTSIVYYNEGTSSQAILDLAVSDSEYAAIWTTFLSSFYAHLSSKGWFDKTVLYMDEIEEEQMKIVIDIVKKHNQDWKIGLSGKWISTEVSSQLYDYSVILNHERNTRTPISTFYTSCTQTIPNNYVTLQNSVAEMTWMAWYAAANDFDGYLRWAYDYWINQDPTDIRDGSNTAGDFSMIYRSDNTASSKPISSMRFELLREGIQDYEKIKKLSNSELNSYLNQFDLSSGINSRKLIEEGQSLLKRISSQN